MRRSFCTPSSSLLPRTLALLAVLAACEQQPKPPLGGSTSGRLHDLGGESQPATWKCTGSPCPWGASQTSHAIAWPASVEPVAARVGYTTTPPVYLPASSANGVRLTIDAGAATVYAGEPQAATHRVLAKLSSGQSHDVSGLAPAEVLSVQSEASFRFRVTRPAPAPAKRPEPPAAGAIASQTATWTCTGQPCPWGKSVRGEVLVWPAAAGATSQRLGYTVSAAIYLPAARANGADLAIETGAASVHAGRAGEVNHRLLATVTAGQTFHVPGLSGGEVLSVQSDARFTYRITLPPPREPPPAEDPAAPRGKVVRSTPAIWRCNTPGCYSGDWRGAVIAWPSWAAYQTNGRAGEVSRSVLGTDRAPLYPYMGAWAHGCKVTCESGKVLIIEWKRGAAEWRETWLEPRQSHVIDLVSPEDGAMIESDEGSPGFSVSLTHCTPQRLPK